MTSEAFPHPDWIRHMGRRARHDKRGARLDELERLVAIGQMAGGRGGPPFRAGGRGRRRRGDVRAALLLLLQEEPRNGYQLMQEIEERTDGRWRPSPGSVYPTLQQLEDEGLIRAVDREGTKLFELTDAGRAHISSHGPHTPPWDEDEDPATVSDLKAQIKQLHVAVMQVAHLGDEEQLRAAATIVSDARRALYRMLAEDIDA